MATSKKAINNLVSLINEKYQFKDSEGELKIVAERGLNGWQLALAQRAGFGGWVVVFTQHHQVSASTCVIILQMLFHDILERQNYGHYSVSKRV